MEPQWLAVVAWVFLGLGFGSALVIVVDIVLLGHRQHMWVMNLVHPITALYLGPVWLVLYFARGRRASTKAMHRRLEESSAEEIRREAAAGEDEISSWHVGNAVSHCGAGCTLGDIGGEWIVFALGPWVIGASGTLGPELALDFPLAWGLGILFQYFTIVPMREELGRLGGLWAAIRADTLSIVAFEVGLFGWMALSHEVIWQPPLPIETSGHWFMMQVGMTVGFFTAWPVNRLLIRRGWKEKMDAGEHLRQMAEEHAGRERGGRQDAVGAEPALTRR